MLKKVQPLNLEIWTMAMVRCFEFRYLQNLEWCDMAWNQRLTLEHLHIAPFFTLNGLKSFHKLPIG